MQRRGPASVLLIVTLASPHAAPPVPYSARIAGFYANLRRHQVRGNTILPRDLLLSGQLFAVSCHSLPFIAIILFQVGNHLPPGDDVCTFFGAE
eukprot:scaffold8734_cov19-Prasinocladus_malaysianus.AAC.1